MIREKIIQSYIKNKDILDIGSYGQSSKYRLWDVLKAGKPKSLTGIDLKSSREDAEMIFSVKKSEIPIDENIIFGNMETYNFNKKFDVIVAGDVIEHVENQGLFINNVRKHLKDNGNFILTTPNVKWINGMLLRPNPTHTLWHDKFTLERILKVCGFKIIYFRYYYGNKKYYNFIKRIFCLRQNMLVICQKNEATKKIKCNYI